MRLQVALVCGCFVVSACSNAGTKPAGVSAAGAAAPAASGTAAAPAGAANPAAGSSATGAAGSGAGAGTVAAAGRPAQGPTAGASAAGGSGAPVAGTAAAGGGTSAPQPSAGSEGGSGGKKRLAVTADFLNQTLSVVDLDKMVEGAKREDVLVGTVDLSMYTPGPLAVAVTPDGKTALVSISGGWLRLLASDIPAGNGTLVFVDLTTLKVSGELNTGASPMGIAITKDGTHAYVGQLSDTYISYVDIAAKTFTKIQTGNSWNEELAIDDTGTTGLLSTGTAGDVMSFSANDAGMTHGQTAGVTGDAGGVAFFPGTLFAFVVQAPTQLTGNLGGYNVVDATTPAMPKVTDTNRVMADMRISYPVTAVASRKSVVYPSTLSGKLSLIEMQLEAGKAKNVQTLEVGDASTLAYGLSSSPEGLVYVSVATEHYIAVVDLASKKSIIVPWGLAKTGPVDIEMIP
jgi:hypothetical protein